MISEHSEIEVKFDAPEVSFEDFKKFLMLHEDLVVTQYLAITSPDVYYEQGSSVYRHRLLDPDKGTNQLTVKRRKSEKSTRDREEIDLTFAPGTPYESVAALLVAGGFQPTVKITKECHIYWAKLSPNLMGTFVIYDVWEIDKPKERRRFIECEAEKGGDVTPETAKRHINTWTANLQQKFKLGEPLNSSLWEIYSGRRYQTV